MVPKNMGALDYQIRMGSLLMRQQAVGDLKCNI